jgi:hypothetical protein
MNPRLKMIEQFQCPGCVSGSDTKCGKFVEEEGRCASHIAGTFMMPGGHIALGLPKGFNKTGMYYDSLTSKYDSTSKTNIHLYTKDQHELAAFWNNCNIPVWALERDGFLFVRVYMPRVNFGMVQVVEGGTMQMIREKGFNPLDVSEFENEFD